MLDWSNIDSDKLFQKLVSHIACLECRTPGFIPSSPYIGADGGYDAYTKNYVEEHLSGNICIQSKYTKHSNKEAYKFLQTEVKKELQKAKKNKLTHLIIATNAELSVPYVNKLLELNKQKGLLLYIWPRDRLSQKIEQQPFLRSYYFHAPAILEFLPAEEYFKQVNDSLLGISLIKEVKGVHALLNDFVSFLGKADQKIFVIHAPGGYGKSHFLRELPGVAALNSDREVWFIRGSRTIQEAINDEIAVRGAAHKYIFVLDDADRSDDSKDVLKCAMKSGIDVKLVISLRTSGIGYLRGVLLEANYLQETTITEIPQWQTEELKTLLKAVSGQKNIKNEDLIVRKIQNPFFIVKVGQSLKKDPQYKFESLKHFILESLVHGAKGALSEKNINVEDMLLHLSLISPINLSDGSTIAKLSEKLKTEEENIRDCLSLLTSTRVLRQIGSIVRFVPDMIGDVFLLEKMESMNRDERRSNFSYWFNTHSSSIFCNLGATLHYGEGAYLDSIIDDVVSNWIQNAKNLDDFDKRRVLENLKEICPKVPQKSADLIFEFLKVSDLTTDEYGPVVYRLIHSSLSRNEVKDLILALKRKKKLGMYDNYKPNTLIRESVSPLRNDIPQKIMPMLIALDEGLTEPEPTDEAELLCSALKEVLALVHEYTESTYAAMTIGGRALLSVPSVIEMRNKAIEILRGMLSKDLPFIRKSAIQVIDEIGHGHFAAGVPKDLPLNGRVDFERDEILKFIAEKDFIGKEKDFSVLSAYEDLLIRWWATRIAPDANILPLFDKFSYQDPSYRIFRYYASRWDVGGDIRRKLAEAPAEGNRWHWAVDNLLERKWTQDVKDFIDDAKALNEKYPTPREVTDFLQELGQKVTLVSVNALFLRAWIDLHPELFRQIHKDKELWEKIPPTFRYTISYDLAIKEQEFAVKVINDFLSAPDNSSLDDARIVLGILSLENLKIDKSTVIEKLIARNNQQLNNLIIGELRFIGSKFAAAEMAKIVSSALQGLSFDSQEGAIERIEFILHGKDENYKREFTGIMDETLYQICVRNGNLSFRDFGMLSIIVHDVSRLLSFIEERLELENKIQNHSAYQAVPFDGFPMFDKVPMTEAEYLIVINQILKWDRRYKGLANYSVSTLLEQVVALKDQSMILWIDKVKEKFYSQQGFPELLACLFKLPLTKQTMGFFKEVVNKSEQYAYEKDMCDLLKSKIIPEEGWSSKVGEVPPAYYEKQEIFEELLKVSPKGVLRDCLKDCSEGVKRMIEDHKSDDENEFLSR